MAAQPGGVCGIDTVRSENMLTIILLIAFICIVWKMLVFGLNVEWEIARNLATVIRFCCS